MGRGLAATERLSRKHSDLDRKREERPHNGRAEAEQPLDSIQGGDFNHRVGCDLNVLLEASREAASRTVSLARPR
jgi:hypothetical protein